MKIMTIDGQVWYPTFYDLDTVLGIDNSGYLTIEPDVEIESGSYNTSNSNLWSKVWNYFNAELKEEWAKMRQGSFTLDNLMNYIYGEQISKIPAKLYNDDAQVKYLEFGSLYTYCCHGSKEHQIRRWLRERIAYVDSMLGYFTSQEDQVTIRMNKTGEVSFEVTPYIPIYFSVKWSNATGGTQTFKLKRGETKTFSYSSTTSTDQEVLIYHAKYIKRLDNLSNLNPSSCILSNATKLTNVEIHSSKLYNINVINNKFLRSINLENCTALGTVTATGSSLNLSNCKYLRYCNVYNTNLTEVQLNTSGGSLTEIYYPKSIQSINLVKQRLLELIGLPYGEGGSEIPTSLYTISIQDCPSITKLNTSSDTTIASSFASMVYVNNLTIRNSLDLASLKFDGFHRLQNVTIENMYNLEEVGFNNLLPVGETSAIKYIGMSNCPKLGTIELNCTSNDYEITFADDAILNFGGLFKLNSITSNCVLKGIKTIVVPTNLESMFFTNEYGSGYSTIENIWVSSQCDVDTQATTPIVTHVDSTYKGIDFLGMNLKNIDLGALVNIPKAINFKLSPTTVNPHFNLNRDGETYKYLQPVGTLDLSNYTESLAKFFDGVDLDKLEIVCTNNLPQTDLSYCFYNSTFSTNTAIDKLLTKVSSITNLDYCFYKTTIDSVDILDEINMGASSSMNYTFAECPNIKSLNNVVIPSKVTSVEGMFNKCPLTTITNMIVNVRGSISGLFKGCNKLTTITTLRIPNVTDISNTFDGCTSLSSLSGFELPSSCTNVSNLFNGCYMLTELGMNFGPNIIAGDNWYPPNLEILNDTTISNDYVKLTNCTTLKTLNGVNVSGRDLSDLFNGCTNLTNITNCTFNATSSLARAFKGCAKITINPITTIVDTVTDISEMYSGCTGITDISGMTFGSGITNATNWITGSPITTANNVTIKSFIDGYTPAIVFTDCSSLVSAKNLRLVKSSTGPVNVTDMFARCTNLEDVNFVNPPKFNYCSYLFQDTSIGKNTNGIIRLYEDLGLSVNNITGTTAIGMFRSNPYIKEVVFPDEEFGNFYAQQMFDQCTNLKIVRNLKSSDLGNMFRFCKGATNVELINCYITNPFNADGCNGITKLTNCTIPSNITNIDGFFTDMNIQNDIEIPSHVTSCVETFQNCTSMTHIHSNWNNSYDKTITSTDCYAGCTGITHVDGENVIYNEYSEGLDEIPEAWGGYGFSVNNTAIVVVEIPSDALTFQFNDTYGGLDNILKTSWGDGTSDSNQKIHTYTTSGTYAIKVKYADATINTNQTILHGNYTPASGNSSLRSAGTEVVQVPIGTQIGMSHFREWSKLQTVHLDRAILNSPSYIFHNAPALERVDLTNCRINGVGKDTWLNSPKITTINIAGSTITDGEYLFTNATALTTILGLDTADFSSNHKITGMFANCKELLTVPPLRTLLASTAKPEDVWKVYLMCSKVTTIDISGVDFSEATRIRQMFAGDTALTNIIGFNEANLSKITDLWNIFGDTPNLALPIDLSNLNRSEPVYMAEAFFNCGVTELSGLSGIMLSAHDYTRTFQSMPNIKNLDVSGLDTSRVTGFGTAWASYIYSCPNVETVDISNLNILGCGAEGSFYDLCRSMGKLKSLVSKNANVSNLTNLATFLYECPELVDLDLESWDISNVTNQGSFVGKSFKLTNFKSFKNINCNMNFSWFPQLTTESLVSIINALKATTTTKTLTLGSKLLAKLTSEQIKIATDKGWTVV
jgi:surface protein